MAGEVSEFAGVVDCGVFLKNIKKRGFYSSGILFGIGSWRFFFFLFLFLTLCFFSNGCNVWKLEPCLTGIRL